MLKYLKSLVSSDTHDRVSAALALLAGIVLCLGFLFILPLRGRTLELTTITAGLVALATFSPLDRSN